MKKVQNQGKVYIAIENPGLLPLAPFVSLRSIKAMGTCSGMAPLTLPGQVKEQVQKEGEDKDITKRQNELYIEVWKLFSLISTHISALLPCAMLSRHDGLTKTDNKT